MRRLAAEWRAEKEARRARGEEGAAAAVAG